MLGANSFTDTHFFTVGNLLLADRGELTADRLPTVKKCGILRTRRLCLDMTYFVPYHFSLPP